MSIECAFDINLNHVRALFRARSDGGEGIFWKSSYAATMSYNQDIICTPLVIRSCLKGILVALLGSMRCATAGASPQN
jgi:hypothetical protein